VRSPCSLKSKISSVRDNQGGVSPQVNGSLTGRLKPQHKLDASPSQGLLRVPQSFEHERIVPQIGLGKPLSYAENSDDGQLQVVGLANRIFESVIASGTLRLLHPVQNIPTPADILLVQQLDALWLYHAVFEMGL
jgi:hypothetical protein